MFPLYFHTLCCQLFSCYSSAVSQAWGPACLHWASAAFHVVAVLMFPPISSCHIWSQIFLAPAVMSQIPNTSELPTQRGPRISGEPDWHEHGNAFHSKRKQRVCCTVSGTSTRGPQRSGKLANIGKLGKTLLTVGKRKKERQLTF